MDPSHYKPSSRGWTREQFEQYLKNLQGVAQKYQNGEVPVALAGAMQWAKDRLGQFDISGKDSAHG